jgi:hypothetical protein
MSVLRRRLALASPLAGLELKALEARSETLAAEIARLEAARAGGSGRGLETALGQLSAAAEAAAGGGGAEAMREAGQLQARALALGRGAVEAQARPQEHDERRLEPLVALDTLASASP